MKNLKIYKSAIALLTATSILLLSGCSGSSDDNAKESKEKPCTHLTVYFGDQPITFKECEGYVIDAWDSSKGGELHYDIERDEHKLISNGFTNDYNLYDVYHSNADELIDEESVQKSR